MNQTLAELIRKFENKPNRLILSLKANLSNNLQEFIQTSKTTTFQITQVQGFRTGYKNCWGLVVAKIGGLEALILGHVTCLGMKPETEGANCCSKTYSHDILGKKSQSVRENKSYEIHDLNILENVPKLTKIMEFQHQQLQTNISPTTSSSSQNTNDNSNSDTPRSSTSIESDQIISLPEPKKLSPRGAGGKLTLHDQLHFPDEKKRKQPETAPNKVKPSSHHTKSSEVTQDARDEIYDLQCLKIVLAGGSLRSADSPADRLLVDKTKEISNRLIDCKPSDLLGGRTVVGDRLAKLRNRLHDHHVRMMTPLGPELTNEDGEFVYHNSSSDATQPRYADYSLVDFTTRYTTIDKNNKINFYKSCVDLRELPKKTENNAKTDHGSVSWAKQLEDMIEKLPIKKMNPKSKPDLPSNKKLDEEFSKLHQFMTSITVDNASNAKRTSQEMALFALFCLCHRLHTCFDTSMTTLTTEFFTSKKDGQRKNKDFNAFLAEQIKLLKEMCAKITWTDICLNDWSSTRFWRGLCETIRQILAQWEVLKVQSSKLEFTMPNQTFLEQLYGILQAFEVAYDRLEHSASLLSESLVALEILREPLAVQEDDMPCIKALKLEVWKQIKIKVLGEGSNIQPFSYCVTNLHKMSAMMIPSLETMECKNPFIGDKEHTLKFVNDWFGSRDFTNLMKVCGFDDSAQQLINAEELEMMGYESESVQPTKLARTSFGVAPLFQVQQQSTQMKWAKKWLSYREYVLKNPVKLSHDSTEMKQTEYSEKVIGFLHSYREHDAEFAELAIRLLLMLPTSSTSEHLFSIANIQARPNTQFATLASRTLVASNSGFFMKGVI